MAYTRQLESFVSDGNIFNCIHFNSFNYITSHIGQTSVERTDTLISDIDSWGTDFPDFIGRPVSSGNTVRKNIDGSGSNATIYTTGAMAPNLMQYYGITDSNGDIIYGDWEYTGYPTLSINFGIIFDDEAKEGIILIVQRGDILKQKLGYSYIYVVYASTEEIRKRAYNAFNGLSGGAGSGYIGNSLLSNKKMVGYNVPTSSAEGTKTESVNEVSASAVSGKPKIGNGFARIKYIGEPDYDIWIDGKRIYEDIIPLENAVVNTGAVQEFDISHLNIDTIIEMHGIIQMKSAQENKYAVDFKHYESGYLYDNLTYGDGKLRAVIRFISGSTPLFTITDNPQVILRYTKA